MKGYLLFLLAVVVVALLMPVAILYNSVRSLFHGGTRLHYIAILIDQTANVLFGPFLNDTMQQDGYEFGHYNETISKVLGINKALNTLTKFGRFWADFLNWLDENHVEKAASNTGL
mgnify:FL=1